MQITRAGIVAAVLISAALAKAQETAVIAAGSQVSIRLTSAIDSAHTRDGEEFAATLDAPLVAGDYVAAQRGVPAVVRFNASPKPSLTLISFTARGVRYTVNSQPRAAADPTLTRKKHGALRGATIGAIGGGLIAGRIGIPLGAGAGALAGSLLSGRHERHPKLPAETKIDFLLEDPISIQMPGRSN